jgi:hypothetical protein
MLKLFHVLDLPKSGIVVMQLFVCGCVCYPWSAMLCHLHERQKTKLHFKTVNSVYTCDINSATGC